MQVGRVAEGADEPGVAVVVVVDGEVVREWSEQSSTDPASEHDLVGVWVWHARTVTSDRVNGLHPVGEFTG